MVVERLEAGGTAAAAVGGVKLLRLVYEAESLQFPGENLCCFYLDSDFTRLKAVLEALRSI